MFEGKSPLEIDEIKASARSLLNEPALSAVFTKLERHYVGVLKGNEVGSLTSHTAHASMLVLEQVRQDLTNLLASERINRRVR